MAKVKVEFWMWLGKDVGPEFVSPTDTRAAVESEIEQGATLRQLFEGLSARYPVIAERISATTSSRRTWWSP